MLIPWRLERILNAMRISHLFSWVLLALVATGCSSGRGGDIMLQSPQNGQFTESFSNAFFSNTKGEYDILLVDNDSAWRFQKSNAKKAPQAH